MNKSFFPFCLSICLLLGSIPGWNLCLVSIPIDAAIVSSDQQESSDPSARTASTPPEQSTGYSSDPYDSKNNINALYLSGSATGLAAPATFKEPSISAQFAVLMDSKTGQVLYKKNENSQAYPASITKIMTGWLAAEKLKNDDIITISKEAIKDIKWDEANIALQVGEQLTTEQIMNAIMLVSANDAANGVAEKVGGSIQNFAKMMTDRAKEIGAVNTQFTNANGLPDDNHYTTAYDMALITREALKNETFKKYFSAIQYTMQPTNLQAETRYFLTHHKMLYKTKYQYLPAFAGKTGYTDKAGSTLVTVATKDGHELICVSLKETAAEAYADAKKLFEYGFTQFESIALPASTYEKSSLNVMKNNRRIGTASFQNLQEQSILVPKGSGCTLSMIQMFKTDMDFNDSDPVAEASLMDTNLHVQIPELMTAFYESSIVIPLEAKITLDPVMTMTPSPESDAVNNIGKSGTITTIFKWLIGILLFAALLYCLYVIVMIFKTGYHKKLLKKWKKSKKKKNIRRIEKTSGDQPEHRVRKIKKPKIKTIKTHPVEKNNRSGNYSDIPEIRKIKTPRL